MIVHIKNNNKYIIDDAIIIRNACIIRKIGNQFISI